MASRSRTDACSSMSSVVAQCLAGALVALEEASVAAATQRALLRVRRARAGLVHQLDPEDLPVAVVSAVASVVVEVAEAALVVIVAAFEEDSAAVGAEVEAVVALVTKGLTATVHLMVLQPVLEDHEVGLALAAVPTAETVAATVMVVTGVEVVTEDPAAQTTNHLAEIDTTTATVAAAETAIAAETTRGSVRTRATATMTGASAGGTELQYALKWVCHRLPPFSSRCLLSQ